MLVQNEIERMIVGGELGAGAKLSENGIAMRLGVCTARYAKRCAGWSRPVW